MPSGPGGNIGLAIDRERKRRLAEAFLEVEGVRMVSQATEHQADSLLKTASDQVAPGQERLSS